jgi:predicted transposase YdaD
MFAFPMPPTKIRSFFVYSFYQQKERRMSRETKKHAGSLDHDEYFQENFSNPIAAAGLVRIAAPPDVVAALDLENMVPLNVAQFDPDMGRRTPDLLFECPSAGGKVVVSILFEHKSRPDYRIALQFLRYILLVQERHLKQESSEPMMVLPILVYHGKVKWLPNFALVRAKHVPEALRPYILHVPGIVLDLGKISEEDIEMSAGLDAISASALMAIRSVFGDVTGNQEFIRRLALKIRKIPEDNRKLFIERTVLYLQYAGSYRKAETETLLTVQDDEDGFMKKFKTGYQLDMEDAEARGVAIGLAEGVSQGISQGEHAKAMETVSRMLKKGCEWDFITEVTGVTKEEYQKEA